jgi:lysyl-tRNA synthetase class 2
MKKLGLSEPRQAEGRQPGQPAGAAFEEVVEEKLWAADLHHGPPDRDQPAGARQRRQPEVTERFELYITGREIANGFSAS